MASILTADTTSWAAQELTACGYAVFALDHRGRGRSDGERYYVEEISEYVDDVSTLVKIANHRQSNLPVFMLGHSVGGVISCTYALDYQAGLAGLICESFAFRMYAPDSALTVLKGLSHLAPHAHVLKLKSRDFSRDPNVVETMLHDPLLENEVQPTLTEAEMVRADERLVREFGHITLPLLILRGRADKVTKPSGSQLFYEKAGSKDKTLELYEGLAHDLLNDLDRFLVMADITGWLNAHNAHEGSERHAITAS